MNINDKLEELDKKFDKLPKMSTWKIVVLTFVGVCLAVVLALYGFFLSKYSQVYDDGSASNLNDGLTYEDIINPSEEYMAAMTEAVKNLQQTEAVEATSEVAKNSEVYNVLLIGTDERTSGEYSTDARGDSCILLSLNTSGEVPVVSLVSLERGIGVPILRGQYAGQWDWLTHTFRYGGADLLMTEIRECFKIDVHHYVRVNFNAFEKGINAIGGVDVYFDEAERDYFLTYSEVPAIVGMNHLNGSEALRYARLRSIDNDWGRTARQREIVISALNKCRSLSLTQINNLIDVLLPMVKTNVPQTKIAQMLLLVPELRNMEIQQTIVPQEGTYGGMTGMGGRSLFAVDFEANSQYLKEFLYNQKQEVSEDTSE